MRNYSKYDKQLKSCPKCGGKAQISISRGEDYCMTGVQCNKCSYYLETREDTWGYYPQDAVKEWNDLKKEPTK